MMMLQLFSFVLARPREIEGHPTNEVPGQTGIISSWRYPLFCLLRNNHPPPFLLLKIKGMFCPCFCYLVSFEKKKMGGAHMRINRLTIHQLLFVWWEMWFSWLLFKKKDLQFRFLWPMSICIAQLKCFLFFSLYKIQTVLATISFYLKIAMHPYMKGFVEKRSMKDDIYWR